MAEHHCAPQRNRIVCMKFVDTFLSAALLRRFFKHQH